MKVKQIGLNLLKEKFIHEWLDDHMIELEGYEKWKSRATRNTARMLKAFNRKSCGYFNPNLAHGNAVLHILFCDSVTTDRL